MHAINMDWIGFLLNKVKNNIFFRHTYLNLMNEITIIQLLNNK